MSSAISVKPAPSDETDEASAATSHGNPAATKPDSWRAAVERSDDFFQSMVKLPAAYAELSNSEMQSHYQAAHSLFQASVPFLEMLPASPGAAALDIGAGYGFHAAWLAEHGFRVTAVATHVTEKLLEHARQHGYAYHLGDMHALPWPDESFELLWSHHSLEHSHCPLGALREWYRLLRKDGWLAVTVPPHKDDIVSGHFHTGWSVGQLLYLLGVAGFELRGGLFLQEGYNVRALVRRPRQKFDPTGASWMCHLKERLPAALLPHMRWQPASLGKWNFPGRIKLLNDQVCEFLKES